MKDIVTKSGKPTSQVIDEARKFCEMNDSPKTLEFINDLYNQIKEREEFMKKVLQFHEEGINLTERQLPEYVIEELKEVFSPLRY